PRYLVGNLLPRDFDPATAEVAPAEPTGYLEHGDVIDLGGRSLEVFHTPGHSPGGITLLDRANRLLFPGDAVYAGPMFAYRPYSDPVVYRVTLRQLAELANVVDTVYPSHNDVPLAPEDVQRMHQAYEEIWAGRTPDQRLDDRDVYDFGSFSFWLRPSRYGDAVDAY
ncbi:MAG: MBL fold metallo-hydrolase, partial [Chloroflexota bacterium]|nr:MBL fold metallo-hydrolase [Chloroflexota bacterium]